MNRNQAIDLLRAYNKDVFHLQHALSVEKAMRWYANDLGFIEEQDFWAMVGLLHDIDFEQFPQQHCAVAPRILKEASADERMIHAVCSHAWGYSDASPQPEHLMEKVLFACDELTGLIGAAILMRPSRSVQDMELKSLKKKFKDRSFASGCSRETICKGAEMLGWELDVLLEKTLQAMKIYEKEIAEDLLTISAS